MTVSLTHSLTHSVTGRSQHQYCLLCGLINCELLQSDGDSHMSTFVYLIPPDITVCNKISQAFLLCICISIYWRWQRLGNEVKLCVPCVNYPQKYSSNAYLLHWFIHTDYLYANLTIFEVKCKAQQYCKWQWGYLRGVSVSCTGSLYTVKELLYWAWMIVCMYSRPPPNTPFLHPLKLVALYAPSSTWVHSMCTQVGWYDDKFVDWECKIQPSKQFKYTFQE